MRQVGNKIGAPAATVSQIEKGQRALKEPKIAEWAAALEVTDDDLHELWVLSQGRIPAGPDRPVFYSDRPDALGSAPLKDADILAALEERPDLEPLYRLADWISAVLRRLLPNAHIQVVPDEFEPPFVDELIAGTITAAEEDANAEAADGFAPLPFIECYWDGTTGRRELSEKKRDRVRVPLLQEFSPIVRRRGKSVKTVELEDLISALSAPERERVRGYVESVVQQRADREE
ncbi:MAG: hypothetical protein QOF21_2140 [Actinomycetota bacterium]|jgi:transcriptional regulator with XRE-family HTH domain